MTADARHLMSVSLGKIAQARSQRGGMKLHHSLLVATVLHKARSAFMEETLRMVDSLRCPMPMESENSAAQQPADVAPPSAFQSPYSFHQGHGHGQQGYEEDDHEGTTDEANKVGVPCLDTFSRHRYDVHDHHNFSASDPLSIWSDADDYPAPPTPSPPGATSITETQETVVVEKVVTIFDLDTRVNCQESALCDITNEHDEPATLKRKRSRDEVEDAVSSIIPGINNNKRHRGDSDGDDADPGSSLDIFSPATAAASPHTDACVQSLTNLVSIFSFTKSSSPSSRCYSTSSENLSPPDSPPVASQTTTTSSLTRSVSTPDLCGSQVFHRREEHHVSRPAIAMTV